MLTYVNSQSLRPRFRLVVGTSAAVIVALAVLVVLIVRHQADGMKLISQTDGSASGSVEATGTRQHRSAYFGSVCISERGSVKIRSIEPIKARGGLQVTDFSVVKGHSGTLGAAPGRLRDEPSYKGSATVTTRCANAGYANLFVEVYKPRTENAWAQEFRINYASGGHDRSTRLRFGFGLCEQTQDDCDIF